MNKNVKIIVVWVLDKLWIVFGYLSYGECCVYDWTKIWFKRKCKKVKKGS